MTNDQIQEALTLCREQCDVIAKLGRPHVGELARAVSLLTRVVEDRLRSVDERQADVNAYEERRIRRLVGEEEW